jgi:hypothetical protein
MIGRLASRKSVGVQARPRAAGRSSSASSQMLMLLLPQQQGTGMQAAQWTAAHTMQRTLRQGMRRARGSTGRVMSTWQLMAILLRLQRAQRATLLRLQLQLQAFYQKRQQ